MQLTIQRAASVPLYRQVAEQVRALIRSGALPGGSRLPTIRQLARDLRLTRLTIQSAYAELQAQGLVESFVGRGTFVAARPPTAPLLGVPATPQAPISWISLGDFAELGHLAERPNLLSFAQAAPAPETYPARELARALRAALADPAALSYGPMQGEADLRDQVSRLLLDRGIAAAPESVVITSGAQQGIDLALRALAAPDEVVLVEEPTYPGAIELAARRGQRLVGIPRDENGLSLAAMEAACRLYQPRVLYLVPTFHNPTGASLSAERQAALLRVARTHQLLLVEDDVYGLLAYDGPAPRPLKAADEDGRVIYVSSFSKVLAPGLRLGAIVAPAEHLAPLVAAKRSNDLISSSLLQRALADYLRRGALDVHLQRVRGLYRERRDAMLAALERCLAGCTWTRPAGGLSVWVSLPDGIAEREFYREAVEHGVGVAPGKAFFPQPQTRAFVRLSFGSHPPRQIEQAISMLGRLLRDHQRRHSEVVARAGRESGPLV
jgi:DNA-binding transcriptional MocR family regulator